MLSAAWKGFRVGCVILICLVGAIGLAFLYVSPIALAVERHNAAYLLIYLALIPVTGTIVAIIDYMDR